MRNTIRGIFKNRSRSGEKRLGVVANRPEQPFKKGKLLVTKLLPDEHPVAVIALCEAVKQSDLAMRTDDPKTFARCLRGCGKDKRIFGVKYQNGLVACSVNDGDGSYLKVWGRPFSYKALIRNHEDARSSLGRKARAMPIELRIASGF